MSDSLDRAMLRRAALAAWRAAGYAEPNPLVGCVIGRADGAVLGIGHHHRFGEAHAEINALADCARRGFSPRGATAWVTLEPCAHTGKTGPCARALVEAGIAEVVYARADPNPLAAGGAAMLSAAGVAQRLSEACAFATRISDPFCRRIATGLPWVIAKWAQTIDGRIATRSGASKWISGATSRRAVHRLRARVDAILTGMGTVRADDPLLIARGVHVRRTALRVVIDPRLEIDPRSALVRSVEQAPLLVVTLENAASEDSARARELRQAGVELLESRGAEGVDLPAMLRYLAGERGVSNVLVEAGPGLLGRLFRQDLVDEAHVYIAPMLLGDAEALSAADMGEAPSLDAARRLTLLRSRVLAGDAQLVYRRAASAVTSLPAPRAEV